MKRTKRLLALAAITAALCCTAAFSACEKSSLHEHTWGEWEVTTPATCAENGVETRVCADDPEHVQTRTLNALGHDWDEWELTTPADCLTAGEETRVCKNDGLHTQTRPAGDALGHTWDSGTVTTPATCTEDGEKVFACTIDGCDGSKTETIDALDHDFGAWTEKTAATCLTKKVEERVCANDATHRETREVGELAAHTWNAGTVTTQPTEDTPGVKTFTCTVSGCGETKTEPVPELSHTHNFDVEWSSDGTNHWKECAGTNCVEKDLLAAHTWDNGTVTTPATCTDEGVKTFTCTTCDKTREEALPVDETAHDYGEWTEKTAATCTAAKVEERTCSHNPAHKDTRTVGEALDHDWAVNWTRVKDPTATEEGKMEKSCLNEDCTEKLTKTLPVLSDENYTKGANSATCTESGSMTYSIELDEETFEVTVNTPPTGHSMSDWHLFSPSETEVGNYERNCGNCDLREEHELPVLTDEAYTKGENTATCTQVGTVEYSISLDGFDDPITFTVLSVPTGHNWGAFVHTPATETEKGNLTSECENCHEKNVYEYDSAAKSGIKAYELDKTYYIYNNATTASTTIGAQQLALTEIGIYVVDIKYVDDKLYACESTYRSVGLYANKACTPLLAGNITDGFMVASLKNNVKAEFDEYNRLTKLTVKVDGITVALNTTLFVAPKVATEVGDNVGLLFKISMAGALVHGENTINITEANATADSSSDIYTFLPTETKTYSIWVPAGVDVLADDEDLRFNVNDNGRYANFKATADKLITFTFLGGKGEYKVTIGDEVPVILTPDAPLSNFVVPCKTVTNGVTSGGVAIVEIGNVEAGTYKLEIKLTTGLMRSMLYFGKNINPDYNEIYGPVSGYGMQGTSEVIFQNMGVRTYNGANYTVSYNSLIISIELELKKGDRLIFAHTNTVDGTLASVTMTKI